MHFYFDVQLFKYTISRNICRLIVVSVECDGGWLILKTLVAPVELIPLMHLSIWQAQVAKAVSALCPFVVPLSIETKLFHVC